MEGRKRNPGFIPSCIILIAMLSACDYFLFREFELVWPFFLFPCVILFALYLRDFLRSSGSAKSLPAFAIHIFVIIPVFAGLIMSIGWMIKINFWGEMIGRITDR